MEWKLHGSYRSADLMANIYDDSGDALSTFSTKRLEELGQLVGVDVIVSYTIRYDSRV